MFVPQSDACVTFDLGSMETEGFEDRKCIDKTERPFISLEVRSHQPHAENIQVCTTDGYIFY